ncbi:hypothetical protein BGX38DRAFT_1264297 [Terfezia claveryi]|nr:hypothetical protein BGX38DRAFT_1264297 [Terfezia claveryi]
MAFQPPTTERRPQISSLPTQSSQGQHDSYHESPASPTLSRHILGALGESEEQEWIVFSPSVTVEQSNISVTEVGTNVERSELWTEGTESRLNGTKDPSYGEETEAEVEEVDHMAYNGYDGDEDSLEPFRENQGIHPVLLPTHDGRGMFPSVTSHEEDSIFIPGIRSLEESLRLLAARNNIFGEANDLNSRIQKWRQEHSAAFIEEMEMVRKQKRRRGSRTSTTFSASEKEKEEEMIASMMLDEDDHGEEPPVTPTEDGKSTVGAEKGSVEVLETFWRRVTRSLMRDIMGIDDRLLEAIFGESLPPSLTSAESDIHFIDDTVGVKWERSLLETIARELGILLQQYTLHPTQGAFSTYLRWASEQTPNSRKIDFEAEGTKTPKPQASHKKHDEPDAAMSVLNVSSPSEVDFKPTLSHPRQESFSRHHAGMRLVAPSEDDLEYTASEVRAEAQLRKEYWEQELGIRVFFSYLKSRFSSSPSSVSARAARKTGATTTVEPHKPIYHQHPLIQRRHQARKSTSGSTHSGQSPMSTSWGLLGMGGYRNGSSCASQSTKTSRQAGTGKKAQASVAGGAAAAATTVNTSTGFYWKVETSVGSKGEGSCVGMGAWGEI